MNNNEKIRHERTIRLIGEEALAGLLQSVVAVVGLGGVGSFAAEALARSGIGTLVLIDADVVEISNLNRQLFATLDNVGQPKVLEAEKRLLSINPALAVHAKQAFLTAQNAPLLLQPRPQVIIDAIDAMAHKLALIEYAHENGIDIVSAGGAGNRLSPQGMRCADVFDSSGDPLCKIMRKELKKRGIGSHRVVYMPSQVDIAQRPPGSMAFVPGSMGLMLAQEAVHCILGGGFS